jgi:predicted ferric reductase
MKAIQLSLLSLLTLVTFLWIAVDAHALANTHTLFAWRSLLLQCSGILAMAVMSAAMLLAMRCNWLENKLNGLDKAYRLHKWLGVTALVLAISHWLLANVPKWLVESGWLIRPARAAHPTESIEIFKFFVSQRGMAEHIGEYAFYTLVVLIAIALIKRFPYRYFFMSHRWIALVYLLLIMHSVVLMNFSYWSTILGVVMTCLMLLGLVAAGTSLFHRIAKSRKVVGEVSNISYLAGVKVNAISIQLKSQWPGHYAGQFAFITFDQHEGAHPFSITSAWLGDGKLSFLIKALGDYTGSISTQLKIGDYAVIEGPYGRFNFEGQSNRQIWIGGGIGITPFVARMKALALSSDGRVIDLFHTTTDIDEAALQLLDKDAVAAGVKLHIMLSARDGHLTGAVLRAKIPDWQTADIWFCGPISLGKAIRSDLLKNGLPSDKFHQELFDMR